MANTPEWTTIRDDTVNKWNVIKDEHRDAAKARAVTQVLADGTEISDLNPLPVKADLEISDIQIGAVEIKDGSTNQRAVVTPNGELLVKFGSAVQTDTEDRFGKQMIASSASATLVSYTVPVGFNFGFAGVILDGEEYGYFEIQVNAVTRTSWRNSGSKRSSVIPFPAEIETVPGDVITIKVTNLGDETRSFEGSLFGTLREV